VTKLRFALQFIVILGVGLCIGLWLNRETPPAKPDAAAALEVQQLQERVAALERRLAEMMADDKPMDFQPTAPPEIQLLPEYDDQVRRAPQVVNPERRGERGEVNGVTFFMSPLGTSQ